MAVGAGAGRLKLVGAAVGPGAAVGEGAGKPVGAELTVGDAVGEGEIVTLMAWPSTQCDHEPSG